jgi:chitodextrinase
LTAAAVSPSQISLSWTASTDDVGVTGYRVYRNGVLLLTLGAVTSLQNTGLSPSTTYSYTVQAIDATGNASGQSAGECEHATERTPRCPRPTVSRAPPFRAPRSISRGKLRPTTPASQATPCTSTTPR